MKQYFNILLLSTLTVFVACTETKKPSTEDQLNSPVEAISNTSNNFEEKKYILLESDMYLEEYYGEKVKIVGSITAPTKTHILKEEISVTDKKEKFIFVLYNDGEELLIYCNDLILPETNDELYFYGSIVKVESNDPMAMKKIEYIMELEHVTLP